MTEILSYEEVERDLHCIRNTPNLQWNSKDMELALNTIQKLEADKQALQAENDRLREALERCKLECEVVEPDETDLFKNLEGWDIYSVITEALSSTPAKALEVVRAERRVVNCAIRYKTELDNPYGLDEEQASEDLVEAVDDLQSIKGER